jgi:hypothetical protein
MGIETNIVAPTVKEVIEVLKTNPIILEWYRFLDSFSLREKKILCLPCAQSKLPTYEFSKSPYYKYSYGLRKKLANSFEIYTISEPLAIHPSSWKWVEPSNYKPTVGVLPYYDVKGLFNVKQKDFVDYTWCVTYLGDLIRQFVLKNKDTLFVFLVKSWKSHGDMIRKAFNLSSYVDCKPFSNVIVLGERCKDLGTFRKGFHFVREYEKELLEYLH